MPPPNLPPALAVGALYDAFLQAALRQFFARAIFETEPMLSASSDGRLAIEPSDDPCVLHVRWFGTRYVLRVPEHRPFTAHETRLARAIGAVLAARYHAILNPKAMVERGELFRGAIEDRYVGAFLDQAYPLGPGDARADRLASSIEVLRVAALSSYENRPISTGVLVLGGDRDPLAPDRAVPAGAPHYAQALTGVKSFFRLVNGQQTLFLVNRHGQLLDIVDLPRWSEAMFGRTELVAPCQSGYEAHARATLQGGHVALVLSPSHEIKVFAEGTQVLTFRHARWQLLDVQAKFELWAQAVGQRSLALRLFQTALDLSDDRQGALFVVVRNPAVSVPQLLAPPDRIDIAGDYDPSVISDRPTRRDLLQLVLGRSITELEPSVLGALASLDGATVTDVDGRLIAAGAILRHPPTPTPSPIIIEGARTTAALAASRFGPVLKVSEDGAISFYDGQRIWDM